jgi:hypothetical protein
MPSVTTLKRPGGRLRSARLPQAHFLHVGKTAGSALRSALLPHTTAGAYRVTFHSHNVTLRDIPAEDAFFFIVRDPVARYVSAFYDRTRQGKPRYDQPLDGDRARALRALRLGEPPRRGARLGGSRDPRVRREGHAQHGHVKKSYWDWFIDEPTLRSRQDRILFIAFKDTLSEDLPALLESLRLDPRISLPTDDLQAHRSPDSRVELTPRARTALREWYAADYDFVAIRRELAGRSG